MHIPQIVIVDDDEGFRNLIAEVLTSHCPPPGVHLFADPSAALEYVKTKGADLIVTDVHMNGMNGLDFLKMARIVCNCERFIVVSADPSMEAEARKAGVSAFFLKPFEIRTFCNLMSSWFQIKIGAM